jgi:hypothetical protein
MDFTLTIYISGRIKRTWKIDVGNVQNTHLLLSLFYKNYYENKELTEHAEGNPTAFVTPCISFL